MAEVNGGTVRPYHAGDSSILVTGRMGKLKWLTMSHSPVGYGVEAGMIDEHDALNHDDLHIVSNMVGSTEMHIEVGPMLKLAPNDTVVVASDGLFDNLHAEEIVEIVRKGPLENAGSKLAKKCRDRMQSPEDDMPCKPDDLTFVLYRANKKWKT